MTVSRRVVITYDAPDERAAEKFASLLRGVAMDGEWPYVEDVNAFEIHPITGQAFSSEPVIPSPEPLVESP